MSDAHEGKAKSGMLGPALAIVLALPLLYILSIGPVGAFCEKMGGNYVPASRQFYYPVIWLHENTPLRRPLEWYVKLWGLN